MSDLQTINAKLDAILSRLHIPAQDVPPEQVPELSASEVSRDTMDNQTIQRDGSTWWLDNSGQPIGMVYGYISKAKNPAMWDRMVGVMKDEIRLQDILDGNGKLARYKVHPEAVLYQGANSFFLLSQLLANPLPPASPS